MKIIQINSKRKCILTMIQSHKLLLQKANCQHKRFEIQEIIQPEILSFSFLHQKIYVQSVCFPGKSRPVIFVGDSECMSFLAPWDATKTTPQRCMYATTVTYIMQLILPCVCIILSFVVERTNLLFFLFLFGCIVLYERT